MRTILVSSALSLIVAFGFLIGCKNGASPTETVTSRSGSGEVVSPSVWPSVLTQYKKIYGASSVTLSGNYVIIKTNGLPDHKSPYYAGTQWASTRYQAYDGTNANFMLAPGRIAAQTYTFKIPLYPKAAAVKQATQLGPIGVSLNGVPFFNQLNGQGQALGSIEINSFDQYDGHPTPMNQYHYHAEPLSLTAAKGENALLGFLLDGFPVYGPVEYGKTITNADLDVYHGHFTATKEYPHGIYHYHITAEAPYINGDGYYGTPGTVSF